jgi:hypothetical protein
MEPRVMCLQIGGRSTPGNNLHTLGGGGGRSIRNTWLQMSGQNVDLVRVKEGSHEYDSKISENVQTSLCVSDMCICVFVSNAT